MPTASSLKKKQQQLRVDQDLLADRWTEVLAAEEYELERPSKSYPKRRRLPRLEKEAPKPTSPAHDMADRPPHGRDREASRPSTQAVPRRRSKHTKARENAPDLREILEDKTKQTRSIYRLRGRPTARDGDRHSGHNKSGWAEHNRQSSFEVRRDIAQYATHIPKRERKRALRDVYAIQPVAPKFNPWSSCPLTFDRRDHPTSIRHGGFAALVLDPIVDGFHFTRVLMDGGSSLNLLYQDTVRKMGIDPSRIKPTRTTFKGVIPGVVANCTGSITLDVVFGSPDNF